MGYHYPNCSATYAHRICKNIITMENVPLPKLPTKYNQILQPIFKKFSNITFPHVLLILVLVLVSGFSVTYAYTYITLNKQLDEITQPKRKIPAKPTPQPTSKPIGNTISIDFTTCTPTKDHVSVDFGSTKYEVKGKSGNFCHMDFGGEVENPNWDGKLTSFCKIPVSQGLMTFETTQYGIDFAKIAIYCIHANVDMSQPKEVSLAKQALAQKLGISETLILLSQIEETEWNDASLGCPQKRLVYPQVITPGYRILLQYNTAIYEYHSNKLGTIVFCTAKNPQ